MTDEEGFLLPPRLRALPISTFSNKCQLNLRFTYDNSVVNTLTDPLETMTNTTSGTVSKRVKGTWEWITGNNASGGGGESGGRP